ncbi:hypothetical protein CALCODRAFT_158459 [Calocera cornea HHB12733]|uniref:Cation/H+ exchanger domain-containing protein n=1 Tax=Calocera cornea HHB12733 TaxID=1353952 RepID=A0A165I0X7_9BASI|nr:hypothetical protein CALCODRAFT_158459 [Calocera cornea HHB12733]
MLPSASRPSHLQQSSVTFTPPSSTYSLLPSEVRIHTRCLPPSSRAAHLPPSAVQPLTAASFLDLLNRSRSILDRLLDPGLIGEVALAAARRAAGSCRRARRRRSPAWRTPASCGSSRVHGALPLPTCIHHLAFAFAFAFAFLRSLDAPLGDQSLSEIYHAGLGQVQEYLLSPLFFASIGFAIPFLELWNGTIVWRGICYSLLMAVGKLLVGGWILFWDPLVTVFAKPSRGIVSLPSKRQWRRQQHQEVAHTTETLAMPSKDALEGCHSRSIQRSRGRRAIRRRITPATSSPWHCARSSVARLGSRRPRRNSYPHRSGCAQHRQRGERHSP